MAIPCDICIEAIKPFFAGSNQKFESETSFAQDTLWLYLGNRLRLLHPFMPYVIEKIWQQLSSSRDHTTIESIMICKYPSILEVILVF